MLSHHVSPIMATTYVTASASSSIEGAIIDLAGWRSVLFIGAYHTPSAALMQMKIQGSATTATSDFQTIAGSTVRGNSGSLQQYMMADVYQPKFRYLRASVIGFDSDTDASGVVTALRYDPVQNTTAFTSDIRISRTQYAGT